jgi:glycosyltransferase involved in cell wall biosynthesis
MRVLVLTTQYPYPVRSGNSLRALALLERLAPRHEITIMAFAQPDDPAVEALRDRGMQCISVSPPAWTPLRKARVAMSSLVGRLPYIMAKYCTPAMRQGLSRALNSGKYDLLHCDSISLAPLAAECGFRPALLADHNVEALIWQRVTKYERRPLHKAFVALQSRKLERVEGHVCRAFDACVAVSQPDVELLRRWYGVENIHVVPNGVELRDNSPDDVPEGGGLAFVGSMDWVPNQDAVRWMVAEVLPLIRRRHSQVTLTIVGRNPPAWMRKMSGNGIRVTGTVEDVQPYIKQSAVCVVPLRIGGGTRLKILEAMAAGRPVVSTSVGAEGLDFRPGRELIIADSPREFAREVAGLLSDEQRRRQLAQAGKQAAERYSWDIIAPELERVWLSLLTPAYKTAANCGK